jgi:transposase
MDWPKKRKKRDEGKTPIRQRNRTRVPKAKKSNPNAIPEREPTAPDPSPPSKPPLAETHKRRWRMRRALWRIWDKKKNVIRKVHIKYALHLSRAFLVLLIPRFSSSQMTQRRPRKHASADVLVRKRNIGKGTVKAMLNWAYYAQRQQIFKFADRTPGFTAIEVTEPWTLRTCSSCGYLIPKSKSKTFQCVQIGCGMSCDRDLNAAKNILLL